MRLLLMRHAQAEPGADLDPERPLTARACAALKQPPAALVQALVGVDSVLTSPYRRARHTAELLLDAGDLSWLNPLSHPALQPNTPLSAIVELLEQHVTAKVPSTLLVVGHQPWLGQLVAWLCEGPAAPGYAPAPGELAIIELDWPAAGLGTLQRWCSLQG